MIFMKSSKKLRNWRQVVKGVFLVYVGKLNKMVEVCGEENELYWSALDCGFLFK